MIGNLYNEENIKDFARIVKEGTKGGGVDLVTADGVRWFRDIILTKNYGKKLKKYPI